MRLPSRPGWLAAPIVGAGVLGVASGAAQFGVVASLGDVAIAFGEATSAEVAGTVGMSAGTLGVGLAVIRLAGAGSLVGSSVADRVGRRPVLLTATALGLVLTLVAAAAPSFWTFVALIALSRPLLSTVNAVTAVVAAEEASSRDRTAAIAFIAASYALGSGLVSVVRGVLDGPSFRVLLAVVGAAVVLLPLVARIVREPPVAVRATDAPRPRLGAVPRPYVRDLAVLCLLAAATSLVTGPAFSWLFVYGENVLGASPGRMGLLILAAGPVGLGGLLAGRAMADHVGRRGAALVGSVLLAAAATWAYGASSTALAVGYLAAIFGSAAAGPAAATLLNEVMPTETRATANGWAAASGVAGAVAGLLLFGQLVESGAFVTAARVLFLPLVPMALLYLVLPETAGTELDEVHRAA